MILADVVQEIADKLGTITGLRSYAYRPGNLVPPVAFPDLPESITYDRTMVRGSDQITLPVNVLVGKAFERAAHEQIWAYVDGSGARSVKATLDTSNTNTYTSCHSVRVESAEFAIFPVGEVAYLAASFNVDIAGSGS